jgi:surface antigen
MNIKIKIIGGVIATGLMMFSIVYFLRGSFDIVQTSLVKYLDGASHQCVAYVERYYQNMFGITIKNVVVAMNLAERAPRYGLHFHKNGGVVIPQPGDVIVFGNKNKIGHVAIVTGTVNDGVFIVEQNWVPSKITHNHGKPLKATYKNGRYTIKDRYYSKTSKDKFWVMGWVSRNDRNSAKIFDFSNDNDEGWLPENHVKYYKNDEEMSWGFRVSGKDPRIVSPVFLDGIKIKDNQEIVFNVKVENNDDATEGVVYLRDENNKWSEQISFPVDYSDEEYQIFAIDLSELRDDFKITQIMLKLANDNNSRGKEIWKIDWLRIGDRAKNIL